MTEHKHSHLINRDRSIRFISKNGEFRAVLIKSTNLSRIAAEKHNLVGTSAILLSKVMTSAALISSTLKGEERAIVDVNTNSYYQRVSGEANQNGEVRGYIQTNENATNTDWNLSDGYFRVTRILYDYADPITGVIELQDGDIDANLSYYYYKSEQIPAGIIISSESDSVGTIDYAGGLMVQAMPGYNRKDLERIYETISKIGSLQEALLCDDKASIEFIINKLPFEFEVVKSQILDFFCRCSKEKFLNKLELIDIEELKEMLSLKQNELVCHYCNSHYYITNEELENLILQKSAIQN